MKKLGQRYIRACIFACAYTLCAVFVSRGIIRHMGNAAAFLGGFAGLKSAVVSMLSQALAQLENAALNSSVWVSAAVAFLVCLTILFLSGSRKKRIAAGIVLAVMFLPVLLLFVCFAEVNDILTFAVLKSFIPMLKSL